ASLAPACITPPIYFSLFLLFVSFVAPSFIDDSFEEALQALVIQRTIVLFLNPPENFALSFRIVHAHVQSSFKSPDLDSASGALVQKLNELSVNFIDFLTPIVDAHFDGKPFNQAPKAATFSTRSGFPAFCSTSFTMEIGRA